MLDKVLKIVSAIGIALTCCFINVQTEVHARDYDITQDEDFKKWLEEFLGQSSSSDEPSYSIDDLFPSTVIPSDPYPMQSTAYEIDELQMDGTFVKLGEEYDFETAKLKMAAYGDNAVVRHSASKSPTKIIAANKGIVFSYPQRSNRNIAYLKQYYEFLEPKYNKKTYITVHRPMGYYGTSSYNEYDGSGRVHIMMNGFDGYINLSECDIVPTGATKNHVALYLGGANSSRYKEDPFLVYAKQPYFEVEQNGNYKDLVYHWFSGWAKPSDYSHEPKEFKHAIGPAAEWMSLGSKYYSDDGYTFYADQDHLVQAGVYYNYYQFLPMRTKTSLTASQLDAYLLQKKGITSSSKMWMTGDLFIKYQDEYGVNALLTYAMGCLESGYGTSHYAKQRNNLFGVAAYDSNPDYASYFSSIDACVKNQMGILLRKYLNTADSCFFGQHLGNKGSGFNVQYAGEPFWGMKIAAIAYDIDKCANNYNGLLTDFDQVALGVVPDALRTSVLDAPFGKELYPTAYGATYQKNHILPLIGEDEFCYKVQSANYIDDFGNPILKCRNLGYIDYDWTRDVGYIPKSSIQRINTTSIASNIVLPDLPSIDDLLPDLVPEVPSEIPNLDDFWTYGEFLIQQNAISFTKDGKIRLDGWCCRDGLVVPSGASVDVVIDIIDMNFHIQKQYTCTPTITKETRLNYVCDMDFSDLPDGGYILCVSADYGSLGCVDDYDYITMQRLTPISDTLNGVPYAISATKEKDRPKIFIHKG